MRREFLVITACIWLSSCVSDSSFEYKISGNGVVHFTAWAKYSGEYMFYQDIDSMEKLEKYPHCISGVFSDQYQIQDGKMYDKKLVTVSGTLFKYSELPEDDRPYLPRKMLKESVIPNFCFGSNVVLIKSMKLARQNRKLSN